LVELVEKESKDGFSDFPSRLINSIDIEKLGLDSLMIDELDEKAKYNKAQILNLDTTKGGGTHWVTIYINNSVKRWLPFILYYDPLGNSVSPVPPLLKKFAEERGYNIHANKYRHQYINSNLCGYFAVMGADALNEINPEKLRPKVFSNTLYKIHRGTPTKDDVLRVIKHIIDRLGSIDITKPY